MKKIIALLAIISIGCNKNDEFLLNNTDRAIVKFTANDGAPSFPKISYTPDGSLTQEYLSFSDKTIKVKFDGATTAPEDITITYKIDPAALIKYNADNLAANPSYKSFNLMPDSTFKLLVTTDVIKKGEVYAPKITDNLVTYPGKIDPSKNYIIPITVSNSAYPSLAGGSGTIFYAIIGNPLAGPYNVTGYFYHPSSPRAFTRTGASGALVPVSDVAVVTELGDLGSAGYYAVLTVPDPYATTIQPVTVSVFPGSISPVYQWNSGLPSSNPGYTPGWPSSGLCNNTYNPATKTFYLRYGYLGGTGFRVTEEVIVRQ